MNLAMSCPQSLGSGATAQVTEVIPTQREIHSSEPNTGRLWHHQDGQWEWWALGVQSSREQFTTIPGVVCWMVMDWR